MQIASHNRVLEIFYRTMEKLRGMKKKETEEKGALGEYKKDIPIRRHVLVILWQ